ncbi:hypothetical protein T8K17_17390 [Thalassobaculum sp. OXR-137]|uniref:hypothetical protein n=1 Tax=Thalassobaculum sp. OXR-137 TaxID=3100173 RepID=UPI002AC9137A|nr:hypothetical protein [Thalassobaculum sp. OXR-137]WPZ33008.1 hypothetical protein T8K17_17390 [Thalassobaculum sp. OXR-137]
MSERDKALKLLRAVRQKIDPDVLKRAQNAALVQIGQKPPEPENEASRLFKQALANGGKRRVEILRELERKFRHKLN